MKSFWGFIGCLAVIFCTLSISQARTRTVTLALVGDLMLGRGVAEAHIEDGWEGVFNAISAELQAADLALGNLESPLVSPTGDLQAANVDNLCAEGTSAHILADAGFDILVTANNHRFDCGLSHAGDTVDSLSGAGITTLDESSSPFEMRINGINLVFFAYDDISTTLDVDETLATIEEAAKEHNIVVVSMHWGMEYQGGPSRRQEKLAHSMAQAGADLIWGHHPHVLQRIEWIDRKGGQSPALVAYSLGNALFDQTFIPDTRQSAVLTVRIDREGVRSMDISPTIIRWQNHNLDIPDSTTGRSIFKRLNANGELDEPR